MSQTTPPPPGVYRDRVPGGTHARARRERRGVVDRHLREALNIIMDMLIMLLSPHLTDGGRAAYKAAIDRWYRSTLKDARDGP